MDPSSSASSVLAPYFSRTRGVIRPGAHRMRLLLGACGTGILPPKPRLLVGGTNGKGTTCAYVESALRQCGFKTGLYTSPHLVHPGERVRVSGIPATEETLARLVERVDGAAREALPDATFFEILTALAFLAFEEANTDIDIIEVGLGGRLDSTNVIAPDVSILTSVGLDHMEFLGTTREAIARDKAWISRRSRPLVLGPLDEGAHAGALQTILRTGARPLDASSLEALCPRGRALALASGRRPDSNLTCSIAALLALENETSLAFADDALARGLAQARWPGRFDVRSVQGRPVIFDAAHNTHGFTFFEAAWDVSAFRGVRPVVVFGSLADKDWRLTLPQLATFAAFTVFTQPDSPRAVPAEDLTAQAISIFPVGACASKVPLAAALDSALARARQDDLPCVVIGSIALLGEAMEYLEVHPFDAPD